MGILGGFWELMVAFVRCVQENVKCTPEPKGEHKADSVASKTDDEILSMIERGQLQQHQLESKLGDLTRAVSIRRRLICLFSRPLSLSFCHPL